MSRPHVTRVSRTEAGRSREMNNRGIRSGRERSSPTWGHGCRGVSGRRKLVDLAYGYEGPPLVFPLSFPNYSKQTLLSQESSRQLELFVWIQLQ